MNFRTNNRVSKTRSSRTASKTSPSTPKPWTRTFVTHDGERLTLFRVDPVPAPSDWWTDRKPNAFGTHAAQKSGGTNEGKTENKTSKDKSKKRKASEASEASDAAEQPAKRAKTAAPSQVRTRAQTKAALESLPRSSRPRSSLPRSSLPRSSRSSRSPRSSRSSRLPTSPVPLAPVTTPTPPSYAVPPQLAHTVPQFARCGGHGCGQHRRAPSQPRMPRRVECRDCRASLPAASMHALRCRHALCRPCLNRSAAKVKAAVASRAAWPVVQDLLDRHAMEQFFTPSPSPGETSTLDAALDLLGLACCGVDTELGYYIGCMDPDNGAAVWLVDELLQEDPDHYRGNRCGWPDCRSLLAPSCEFRTAGGLIQYLCVQCSGVSTAVHGGTNVPARSS